MNIYDYMFSQVFYSVCHVFTKTLWIIEFVYEYHMEREQPGGKLKGVGQGEEETMQIPWEDWIMADVRSFCIMCDIVKEMVMAEKEEWAVNAREWVKQRPQEKVLSISGVFRFLFFLHQTSPECAKSTWKHVAYEFIRYVGVRPRSPTMGFRRDLQKPLRRNHGRQPSSKSPFYPHSLSG